MNFTFENQGTNTYLVYRIAEGDELDTMSLGMLTNNEIPGFVPVTFTQVDNDRYIKYNVSSRVSATQLFTGAVSRKRLLGVISGIVNAMIAAEDYMLDPESLLLDTDYIFADVSTGEAQLICLPFSNEERQNEGLASFLRNILFNTQFDTTESSDHVVKLMNYLNSVPAISLGDLKALVEKLQNVHPAAPVPRQAPCTPAPQEKTFMQKQVEQNRQPSVPVRPAPPQQPAVPQQPAIPQPQQPAIPQPQQPVIPQASKPEKVQKGKDKKSKKPEKTAGKSEKKMSFFYLMQHYSKENAAIYKQQQEEKKEQPAKPAKPAKPSRSGGSGFAIPGREAAAPSDFAIPGRAAPSPTEFSAPAAPAAPEVHSAPEVQAAQAAPVIPQMQPQNAAPISFGETTVLGSATGETTVLGGPAAPSAACPYLLRRKDGTKVQLNKPVFRIGKERSYVDYFIADNTAISRSHANIINRDGNYFIVDTNSTNHTYVNGTMIPSNVESPLAHGCRITLANEDFDFNQY